MTDSELHVQANPLAGVASTMRQLAERLHAGQRKPPPNRRGPLPGAATTGRQRAAAQTAGLQAGRAGADPETCPYDHPTLALAWSNGYAQGAPARQRRTTP